jgi:hypothetical protein
MDLRIVAMSPNPAAAMITVSFDSLATVDLFDRVSAPGQIVLALTAWEIRSVLVAKDFIKAVSSLGR